MTTQAPKYIQLVAELRQAIDTGLWPPGSQIPTETDLADQYGFSRGTVRQALQLLTQKHLLSREQGRGTFVTAPSPGVALSLSSFNEAMRGQGRVPSTQVLGMDIIPADVLLTRRLDLGLGTPVLRIERLRLADGAPVAHEIRWMAESLCPGLTQEDLAVNSIHELLIHKYHVPLTRMAHTITLGSDTGPSAELLQVDSSHPLFAVERLTYTTGNRPAVLYHALFRSDQYHFVFEVKIDSQPVLFG